MNPENPPSGKYEQLEINFESPNEDVLGSCRETSEELDEARKREETERRVDQGVGSYYGCEQRISPDKSRKPSPYDHQTSSWLTSEQCVRNRIWAEVARQEQVKRDQENGIDTNSAEYRAKLRARDEKRKNQFRNPYC